MPYGKAQFARTVNVPTQQASLEVLAKLVQECTADPLIRNTAIKIVRRCASRDDACELAAVYEAVKHGDPGIKPLRNGFKYIADPRWSDYFTAPTDTLNACAKGACGGDCDDHAALIAALLGSIGWRVGLRAWGPANGGDLVHVYAVAAFPKRPPYTEARGLDTTVSEATAGWEPPRGNVITAWLE